MAYLSNIVLICSATGVGLLLDTIFYYRMGQIRDIYTNWWFSLADTTLRKVNEATVRSLLRLDHLAIEPRLFSLNAFVGIAIFSWILAWLALMYSHGTHSLHDYYVSAGGIGLLLFPFLLVIVTLTRWVIRVAAHFNSPIATGLIGLFLGGFIVVASMIGYRIGGGLLPFVPLWAFRNGFSTSEQIYVLTFAYNLFTGIGNVLIYVSLIPFYYYLFVSTFIFLLHLLAKLFERHIAGEVDSASRKVFTSGGFLIGALANLAILVFIPVLNFAVAGLGQLEVSAGTNSALDTAAYLGKTITDPKEKAAMDAFGQVYLKYLSVSHSPQEIWADGAKGSAIIYRHFTGHEPPPEH